MNTDGLFDGLPPKFVAYSLTAHICCTVCFSWSVCRMSPSWNKAYSTVRAKDPSLFASPKRILVLPGLVCVCVCMHACTHAYTQMWMWVVWMCVRICGGASECGCVRTCVHALLWHWPDLTVHECTERQELCIFEPLNSPVVIVAWRHYSSWVLRPELVLRPQLVLRPELDIETRVGY